MSRPGPSSRFDLFEAALRAGVLTREQVGYLALGLPAPPAVPQVDPDRPRRVGDGQALFSTCVELERPLRFVWDVNGYYRDLGVATDATKQHLYRAYLARDGQSSPRLTYVLAQLLDATTRRQYDAMPPLSIFPDRYVIEAATRQVKVEVARRIMAAGGDVEAAEASMVRDGLITDTPPEQQVDEMLTDCDDQQAPPQNETPPASQFPWGHYLWRSPGVADPVMAEWQRLVVRAAAERGIRTRIAVGACGRTPHRTVVTRVGQVVVAWLNHLHEPTEEVARLAAEAIEHGTTRPAEAGSNASDRRKA